MTVRAPLEWDFPKPAPAVARETAAKSFAWPDPPGANGHAPLALAGAQPCDITGLNHKRVSGMLSLFLPEEAVAHVQLPGARATVPLRFDQFRALTLTTPLASPDPAVARSKLRIVLDGGTVRQGETVGHVENEFGLFLFPPVGEDGSVLRQFMPRGAFESFEIEDGTLAEPADGTNDSGAAKIPPLRAVTTPKQLFEAIDRQARMPMVRIGEALTSLGMISESQLADALAEQKADRSQPLGEVLVRRGAVSRADLQVALAHKMGYPLVDLNVFPVEAEALRKLNYGIAQRLQAMPVIIRDGRLIVALEDPGRRAAVDEVEFSAQMKVVPVLARSRDLDQVMFAAYEKIGQASGGRLGMVESLQPIDFSPVDTGKLVEALEREGTQPSDEEAPIEQSDNSLVRMINRMIIEAYDEGVSDIHIESYPGREKIRIRFRKDGRLRTYLELPPNYRNAMIARIKIMCDLDISEKRKPQDGKIGFAKFSPQHRIELRVATIPTNNGLEDVVMRILASAKPLPLDRLGLSAYNLAELTRAVERPYGMVLCVGPTGSGKTTTLHSALNHINQPERKIWTAEDPIEITQPGLRQVQVSPRIDWTFAKALRAFLRADPDVIMVGEIRDEETANVAIEASLTGHLVLSTLHTNSAPETVTRLLDMGMDPFNFADSLLAVLAQRLVRRLCTECRVRRPATEEEVEELLSSYLLSFGAATSPLHRETVYDDWLTHHGQDGGLSMYHSPGCPHCDQTGFKGRVGLHELMVISRDLRLQIQTGSRAEALQETALREGMRTLRQDGIVKVLAGLTTMEEVRATSNA